jgi:hypothetical protein
VKGINQLTARLVARKRAQKQAQSFRRRNKFQEFGHNNGRLIVDFNLKNKIVETTVVNPGILIFSLPTLRYNIKSAMLTESKFHPFPYIVFFSKCGFQNPQYSDDNMNVFGYIVY